jgi:hypothetical protein
MAQDEGMVIYGTVTYVTSTNVYVKFDSTDKIKIGDVLSFSNKNCLSVSDKSSTSVVCTPINDCLIKKGDTVAYTTSVSTDEEPADVIEEDETIPAEVTEVIPETFESGSIYQEKIRGKISVASYNLISKEREDRHRFLTRFSINADHIDNSSFSIESHIAYRNVIVPSDSRYKGRTSIFNVYNLNARYDINPTMSATLGRKINPKVSTIGAVDGLQFEKYFNNTYVGLIGGFRPDFSDYGFNSDLLLYGGYVGIETDTDQLYSQTSIGAIQQTNSGKTDRRYLFLQHYSRIASDLSLFSSAELDIFGKNGNNTRLTNLYLSAQYRFSRAANVMISYDSRKRIIYYETYPSDIERLLDEDLARQGVRIRLNLRPVKTLWAGVSYSKRFQNDSENKSDNIYGYITLTKIPKIGGRFNVSYNRNSSNYLTSNILSISHYREIVKNKLSADIYYRLAKYDYERRETNYDQSFYGLGLSYRISRTWQFNFSGELSQFDDENTFRFYTSLIKRFKSKKKK